MPSDGLRIIGVGGLPEVEAGADIAALIADTARADGAPVVAGDIVVIAQKIVSKAEGRIVRISAPEEIRAVARREARRILRDTPQHLIVETTHGFVCANAGVDASNVGSSEVALLPKDPDASAARIRTGLESRCGRPIAVIVTDTFGRAWRMGQTNVAIGSAGLPPMRDYRGRTDPAGHELAITEIAHLDELAGAAELVMGKLDRVPVAIVRGYPWEPGEGRAVDLVRPSDADLFR